MPSASGRRQPSPSASIGPSASTSRASVSSSMASSHCASRSRGKSRANSSPRSRVSGVIGSSRRRSRWPSSPKKFMRGAKPKSANSATVSTSRQMRASIAPTAARCGSLRCRTLSRCLSRSTGVGVLRSASPSSGARRSHSISRTSHRWRSASGAFGSAALSSAVRSQPEPARAIGRLNAARTRWSARTRAPARRRVARPRSCRRTRRASCRAAWRCASSWCTRNSRRA